jgi:hypothetical protein
MQPSIVSYDSSVTTFYNLSLDQSTHCLGIAMDAEGHIEKQMRGSR